MPSWPAAVLFDFDGVIVNSEPLHFAGFRNVLAGEQIQLSENEYYHELIGFDDRGAFKSIFAKHHRSLDAQTLNRLTLQKSDAVQAMIENREYAAMPGVDALVRGLAKNYPLAICSGALRAEIELMLNGIDLREYFPIIVAAEDVSVGKPDPQGYLLAIRLIQERIGRPLLPTDCLIIEDAPTVIQSVKAAGFKTIGVATSYPIGALNEATYVMNNLHPDEVRKHIPGLKIG